METQAQHPTPASSLYIKVDGQDREIFMSFGLLNQLTHIIGDMQNVGFVHVVPEVRAQVLNELLAERTKGGKVTKIVPHDEAEVSLEDVQKLLDFAVEHMLDFTLRATENLVALQKKQEVRALALKSSLPGQGS